MATVAVMWSAWLALLLTLSLSVCGETVHYNQELLTNYARLCQQLRMDMSRQSTAMSQLITQKNEVSVDARARVDSAIVAAYNSMRATLDRLNTLLATAKLKNGRALAAAAGDPFEDRNLPIFNDVRLDHGMHYSPVTGESTITQTGLYMLEFKNQARDFNVVRLKIDVMDPNGNQRYNFFWYTDWEISPYFELLYMEVGDVLDIKSFAASGNTYPPSIGLVLGSANMFVLRYLGQMADDSSIATVPPASQTTTVWNWGG